jgi:glycine betaine/proline transport system substrate-binding protein
MALRSLLQAAMTLTVLVFTIVSCSSESSSEPGSSEASRADAATAGAKEPVELVYVDWASEAASANVVKAVIQERLDREVDLKAVTLIAMWQAIASGDKDGMVAAWLPSLQARFLEKHRADVENLGPNLEGTRIGLVVPDYVEIDAITELPSHAERLQHRIIGIDPHAGLMETTEEAMDAYGLSSFELVSGSGPTMTTALENAIEERQWIVVTGWTPHWKFARFDLEYLKDPQNVYGDAERINTIVRSGLEEDMPEVYAVLDAFYWEPADMQKVMLLARGENTSYFEAAEQWVHEHQALVDDWVGE